LWQTLLAWQFCGLCVQEARAECGTGIEGCCSLFDVHMRSALHDAAEAGDVAALAALLTPPLPAAVVGQEADGAAEEGDDEDEASLKASKHRAGRPRSDHVCPLERAHMCQL
jgi:hypothetical protein